MVSTPGRGRRRPPGRCCARSRLPRAGITVTATSSDSRTATEIATAMSRKSCATSSFSTRMGMNTITVVRAETSTAPHTSDAPRRAASRAGIPSSRSRKMFSSTTIAASTTMPTANARPASEMTLIDRPSAAIAHERPDDGDRNREHHGDRRPPRAQEDEQHDGREEAADIDVLLHEIEGGVDVHGLVVDLPEGETGLVHGARHELRGGRPQPVHRLDDVRADLPLDAYRERWGAEVAYPGARFLVGETYVRDIPHGEPGHPSGHRVLQRAKEHPAHVFRPTRPPLRCGPRNGACLPRPRPALIEASAARRRARTSPTVRR